MLQQRILTALILVPLVVAGVLWLPTPQFALVLALFVVTGGWEWSRLAGIASVLRRLAFVAVLVAWLVLFWTQGAGPLLSGFLVLVVVFWLIAGARLWQVRQIEPRVGLSAGQALAGILVLGAAWAGLVGLHRLSDSSPKLVLFVLVLIWVADTAAFFAGRQWGRAKLAPVVSPGKTWAGVYGALAGAVVCGLVLGLWRKPDGVHLLGFLLLSVLTAVVSIVGDLYESLLKRQRGLKDSGNLLPGHGGMLDRIDSLIAAAPLFAVGIFWLERSG